MVLKHVGCSVTQYYYPQNLRSAFLWDFTQSTNVRCIKSQKRVDIITPRRKPEIHKICCMCLESRVPFNKNATGRKKHILSTLLCRDIFIISWESFQ